MATVKEKVCKMCNKKFVPRSNCAIYCEECRPKMKKKYNQKYYLKMKGYYKASGKSINKIIQELEAYNREHKTHLTYGQYVLKIEGGNGNENKS